MKQRVQLDVRTTYHYRTGFSHMDSWEKLTEVRVSKPRAVREDDDSWEQKMLVTISPEHLRKAKAAHRRSGAPDSFTRWMQNAVSAMADTGCTCEHDCCGHAFGHGTAHRTKPREFTLTIYRSINN